MSSPESFKSENDAEKIAPQPADTSKARRIVKLVATIVINLILVAIAAGLIWAMWLPGIMRSKYVAPN